MASWRHSSCLQMGMNSDGIEKDNTAASCRIEYTVSQMASLAKMASFSGAPRSTLARHRGASSNPKGRTIINTAANLISYYII